jgi:hypothetical protein
MTDEQKPQTEPATAEEAAPEPAKKRDPVRLITAVVLVICVAFFWYCTPARGASTRSSCRWRRGSRDT